MYFYRNANNSWIIGSTIYDLFTTDGLRELTPEPTSLVEGNYTRVSMTLALGKTVNDKLVTEIKKNAAGQFYATFAEFYAATSSFFTTHSGIVTGKKNAVLSDTVELVQFGWIRPILLAGTIKYVTEDGDLRVDTFDLKETSLERVRQIYLTGTTANMGIVVYP